MACKHKCEIKQHPAVDVPPGATEVPPCPVCNKTPTPAHWIALVLIAAELAVLGFIVWLALRN